MNGPGGRSAAAALAGRGAAGALRAGAGAGRGVGRGYRALGLELVPGHGLPGRVRAGRVRRVDAAAARLRDVGVRRRLAYAIGYARDGFPAHARDRARDRGAGAAWTTSAALWGRVPAWARGCATRCWRTPTSGSRGRAGRRARRGSTPRATPGTAGSWPRRWSPRSRPAVDSSGAAHAGVLSGDDLAAFSATLEAPVSLDFRGWTVFKTGPWGQGPVFLQQLALLDGLELGPFLGVEHVHAVIECAKLAFADREAFYGDSAPVPLDALLSRRATRRRGARWWATRRPASCGPGAAGGSPSRAAPVRRSRERRRRRADPRRHLPSRRRRPLRQPRLGDAQRRLAAELARDRRARVLPRHARADVLARGRAAGVAGAAGGGRGRRCRRRWRCATTAPCSPSARPAATSRTSGRSSSSSPTRCSGSTCRRRSTRRCSTRRTSRARSIRARPSRGGSRSRARVPAATVAALRARGHDVVVADDWSLGRLSAVSRSPDGVLRGAANPRGMQGYAVGR